MFRKLLFAGFTVLTVLAFTDKGHAHEWEPFATLPTETLSYDKSSVTKNNDAGDIFTIKATYPSGKSVIRDYEFYCKKAWVRIVASAEFDANGKVTSISARPTKMDVVTKYGIEGEKVFEKVCD